MNALDQQAFDELNEVALEVRANQSVRAVYIHARGEHFCAGADINFLQGAVSDPSVFKQRANNIEPGCDANEFQRPALAWFDLNIPVVAGLQGVVYGAGAQIALAADFRISSPTLAFSLFEINWGLIPDMGVTQTLPRLVKSDVAAELVMTGRVVKAQEAQAIGLVTRLVDNPDSHCRELLARLVSLSPDAVQRAKVLMRDAASLNRADALRLEATLQGELVGTANQIEAARAKIEKRAAVFTSSTTSIVGLSRGE
jgi:enoyl-CoA hydratase/carnithine racemase